MYDAYLFQSAIALIEDRGLANFVWYFLNRETDSKFFSAPSSSTGKHHPPEDNGVGGLMRHNLKAIQVGICLSRLYEISKEQRDLVIAAVILHDTYKNKVNSDYLSYWTDRTNYEHGKIGADAIRRVGKELREIHPDYISGRVLRKINYVARLVEKHMSNWAKPKIYPARKQNLLERIVIEANYLASRKGISFVVEELLEDN